MESLRSAQKFYDDLKNWIAEAKTKEEKNRLETQLKRAFPDGYPIEESDDYNIG